MPSPGQPGTAQASKDQAAALENSAEASLRKSTQKEEKAKAVLEWKGTSTKEVLADTEKKESSAASPKKRKAPPGGASSTSPRKPKSSKASSSLASKMSASTKQGKQEGSDNQALEGESHAAMLARKRAVSRKSSRKLREREKQGLEECKQHAKTLRENNIQLKAENCSLKSTIHLVKSMMAAGGGSRAGISSTAAAPTSGTLAQPDAKPPASPSVAAAADGASSATVAIAAKAPTVQSHPVLSPPTSATASTTQAGLREQLLELSAAASLPVPGSIYQAKAEAAVAATVSEPAPNSDTGMHEKMLDRLEQELQGRLRDVQGRNNSHLTLPTENQLGPQQQVQLLQLQRQQLEQQQLSGSGNSNRLESAMLELLTASRPNAGGTGSTSSTAAPSPHQPLSAELRFRQTQPSRGEPQTSQSDSIAQFVSSLTAPLGGGSNTINTDISATDAFLARSILLQHQQQQQRLLQQQQQLRQLAQRDPNLLILLLQQEQQRKREQQLEQLVQQRAEPERLQQLELLLQQQQQQPTANASSLTQLAAQLARQTTAPSRGGDLASNALPASTMALLQILQQQQQQQQEHGDI